MNRMSATRENRMRGLAADVSENLPGEHRVRIMQFDSNTGNPTAVISEAAAAERGNYVQRAMQHVQSIGRAMGLEATQPAEFIADPNTQVTSSGSVTVHLQQQFLGIPIFQASGAVRFSPSGAVDDVVGSLVTLVSEVDVSPKLTAVEAVLKAAAHVAVPRDDEHGATDDFGELLTATTVDLTGFDPRVTAVFSDKPDQPTVLEGGPFDGSIRASLTWFPMGDHIRLAWEMVITMPNLEGQFRVLVDSETGEILYCAQLMKTVAAQGNVYLADGSGSRQMVNFPRPLSEYSLPLPGNLPTGFPDDWVSDNRAVGNSTFAHLGASGPTISGAPTGGVVTFNPADPIGDDQKVLNIFFYNCFMHDFFYLLGFQEGDGNFQENNFGRGGRTLDSVDARAHSGAVNGTANMLTLVDGSRPVMNMGLVTSTGRHTAFDSTVVFHEFMHGVTNRLVGGPLNDRALEQPQSGGMGEGWGDYIACTINNVDVVGAWVVNRPNGIRQFRYDSNFPDHFGKIGTGRYDAVHNIGEIWCATLLEINRKIGKLLAVQLVVDALKLSPANPSFLNMRDAILKALDNKLAAGQLSANQHADARREMLKVFAKFGMGSNAQSNGASLSGIVPDFQSPVDPPLPGVHRVTSAPNLPIPDNAPAGVSNGLVFSQAGKIARLTVEIDIQHTFIGDLRVNLTGPSGASVLLHNRSGGNAHDLIRSFTSEGVADLAALSGQSAQGTWTLNVADLAGADIGTLRQWSLEVGLDASTDILSATALPSVTIPDNDSRGVDSTIALSSSKVTTAVKVDVDITHTYIGDLRVELIAPSGQRAVLHNRQGGSQDNLITTYNSALNPALTALIGQAVQGTWTLHVTDLAAVDSGKLNKWTLDVEVAA